MATSVTVDISDNNYTQMDTYVTERSSTNATFINSAITHYLSFLKGEYDD
jgi:hypothetical protein